MKYKMMPVMTAASIEREVYLQYNEQIHLRDLFWSTSYCNDSYKSLYFGEMLDSEHDLRWYGETSLRQMNLVYSILQDFFGQTHDTVLVDVTW